MKNRAGFSLVEVIVVVAVIGIIASIAIPNYFSWLPNMRLKGAARDLFSNMQRIKMEAIKTNRDHAIVFDTANNKYLLCSNFAAGACLSVKEIINLNGYGSGVGYGHGNVPEGNSATTVPGNFPADNVSYTGKAVVFSPQGTSTAGYVYMQNQDNTAYAVGTPISGAVFLRRWMGGKWQ